MKKKKFKISFGRIIGIFLLVAVAACFFLPMYWMFRTALMDSNSVFTIPVKWWPDKMLWENFSTVFRRLKLTVYIRNTVFTSIVPVVGVLFSAPLIAYSLTKIPWRGGQYIFPIILFTMMIPWQVTQIPMYSIWAKLGLTDSYVPLLLPCFFGSAYYIYLVRQYMKSLPNSIMEAARIDGANEFRILYTVVYPMCQPVLATIAVMVFIAHWNDLNGPLLYLQDSNKYTLSIGLQQFRQAENPEWPLLMAASAVFTIPLIVLFFCAQKYFLNGISTTSGLK